MKKKIFLLVLFAVLLSSFVYSAVNDYIAWWKAEDNYLDETGVFNGSNSGVIIVDGGVSGKRFNFSDAQTSDISVNENNSSIDLANSDACFSFWLSVREFDDADTLLVKDVTGSGWLVNMRSTAVAECDSGTCMCFTVQGAERECQGTGAVDISSDSLDHWVISHDGDSVYFYQNGSIVSIEDYSTTREISATAQAVYIGGYGEANYLTGTLDEIKIFNHNCTQSDVTALFTEFDTDTPQTNVSCFGDSITTGSNLPDTPNENFCHLIGQNDNYNDFNDGNDGDSCEHLANRITDVTGEGHNYTITMCGTNDVKCNNNIPTSQTFANLTYIIEQIKSDGQTAILSTIPPINDSSECIPENNQTLVILRNDVVRRVSYDQDVCLVDINTDVFNNTYNVGVFIDGYHPNAKAHSLMNESFFDAIYNSCSAFDCVLNPNSCYNFTIDLNIVLNTDLTNNTNDFENTTLSFHFNITFSGSDKRTDYMNMSFYVNDILNNTLNDINVTQNTLYNFTVGSVETPFNISFNLSNFQIESNIIYAFFNNVSTPVTETTNTTDTAEAINNLTQGLNLFWFWIVFLCGILLPFVVQKLSTENYVVGLIISEIIFLMLFYFNQVENIFNLRNTVQDFINIMLLTVAVIYALTIMETSDDSE